MKYEVVYVLYDGGKAYQESMVFEAKTAEQAMDRLVEILADENFEIMAVWERSVL